MSIPNTIVTHYAGSLAYGTSLPTSDVDIRGIFVGTPIQIRTPFFQIREQVVSDQEDTKLYELSQFMKLALDCNPNVIETLWVDDKSIIQRTPAYELLRKAAPQLLTTKIGMTTVGYANSQLKRIKGHAKWINNPQPELPPQQVDFVGHVHNFSPDKAFTTNLREYQHDHVLVPYSGNVLGLYSNPQSRTFDSQGNLITDFDGDVRELGVPIRLLKYNKEEYRAAHDNWSNYWTWKAERNPTRSKLEEEHGFDTKHAMHLVRLLRMGVEALETGQVNVLRPDADELLSIRRGAWTYDQLIEYSDIVSQNIDSLVKRSPLPSKPDLKLAADLMIQVQDMVWGE